MCVENGGETNKDRGWEMFVAGMRVGGVPPAATALPQHMCALDAAVFRDVLPHCTR